jgi:DNA-binding phage protein
MDKLKTSIRRKPFSKSILRKETTRKIKSGMGVDAYDPTKALLDEERIGRAIWECLKKGDSEGVVEIIQIHLEAYNKTRLAKAVHIPKTTMYHSFRSKNPTIRTLAKLIHACM